MNSIKLLLIILSVSTTIACSTTQTTAAFTPIIAGQDKTVIYVYRPPVMANMMYAPDLYINDEFRITVRSGEHYHFTLNPGDYSFLLKHEEIDGNDLAAVTLTAGSVYYFRVTTSLKLNHTAQYQPYQRQFTIMAIDTPLATQQISDCCLSDKPAKSLDDDDSIATGNNKVPDTGFSVDKTQNPFSH